MKLSYISCGAAALILATMAGCAQSPIPLAGNFELTEQKKVRSAGHWQLVARDVARETLKMLDDANVAESVRISLPVPDKASTFEKVFNDMLATELTRAGRMVYPGTVGHTLQINYNIHLVEHKSDRPRLVPGLFTMVGAGVSALYGLRNHHVDTQIAGGLATLAVLDVANSMNSGGPTNFELVLTTAASLPDRVVTRRTDVYYIENADTALFKPAPEFKAMKVVNQ